MHLSIYNINIPPPVPPRHTMGIWHPPLPQEEGIWQIRHRGGEFDRLYIRPNASKVIMLNDDIAPVTEWLTKNRLQKLRDSFELNYKITFYNFNMKKGQMVLIAY